MMGDSQILTLPQGYYVKSKGIWLPALDVPLSHTMTFDGDPLSVLQNDFGYMDEHRFFHAVMSGLPTDGLTIPRFLWWLLGHPYGVYLMAGIIHDRQCALARSLPPGHIRNQVRLRADKTFGEGCAFLTPQRRIAPCVFEAGVRTGAQGERLLHSKAKAFYEIDLEQAYLEAGIPHMIEVELGRRQDAA